MFYIKNIAKKKLIIFLLATVITIYSCSNSNNQLIDKVSTIDSLSIIDSIQKLESAIGIAENNPKKTIALEIDSSKLIKAFDNIYFGLPENVRDYLLDDYSINYNTFKLSRLNFDKQFGLYSFDLNSSQKISVNELNDFKNGIAKIISTKYGNPQKISLIDKSPTMKQITNKLNNENTDESEAKIPFDDNQKVYILKWSKNSISISLAYEIGYKPKFHKTKAYGRNGLETIDIDKIESYEKCLTPFLHFEYKPYKQNIIKEENNKLNEEANKF